MRYFIVLICLTVFISCEEDQNPEPLVDIEIIDIKEYPEHVDITIENVGKNPTRNVYCIVYAQKENGDTIDAAFINFYPNGLIEPGDIITARASFCSGKQYHYYSYSLHHR